MSTTIEVTGRQPSTITVGRDLGFDPIVSALDEAATKVLIVHARPLARRAEALAEHLRSLGYEAALADHPDAEASKAIGVVAGLWDTCGAIGLGRKDAVVAMGGGATTDMAGFVAATWLRGVALINVPTTLLQVKAMPKAASSPPKVRNISSCGKPPQASRVFRRKTVLPPTVISSCCHARLKSGWVR